MADAILQRDAGLEAPAWQAVAVSPANSNLSQLATRALYVGTGGTVVVYMSGRTSDAEVTFANVPDGSILPIRVDQVRAASTASDIVALY